MYSWLPVNTLTNEREHVHADKRRANPRRVFIKRSLGRLFVCIACLSSILYANSMATKYFARPRFAAIRVVRRGPLVPLIFNTTVQLKTNHLKEFGNTAIAPAAPLCESSYCQGLSVVFIRANRHKGKRWGQVNLFGIANITTGTGMYPGLTADESNAHNEGEPQNMRESNSGKSDNTESYRPNTTDGFGNIWKRQLCKVDVELHDSRVFYTQVDDRTLICALGFTTGKILSVNCFQAPTQVQWSAEEHLNGTSCLDFRFATSVPPTYAKSLRNITPLVHIDHVAWMSNKSTIWLFDATGSKIGGPFIYPMVLNDDTSHSYKSSSRREGYSILGCKKATNWRGNSPVVQFTSKLWITIVHTRGATKRSKENRLGRVYENKVVIFESEVHNGLPRRCSYGSVDSSLSIDSSSHRPFVFILGLTRVSTIRKAGIGDTHTFMMSGARDDFLPFIQTFDIFVSDSARV